MPNTPYKCLVTIVRANIADPRVVTCLGNVNRRLFIPMQDYDVPQANGAAELMLRPPNDWFAEVGHIDSVDYDLICRHVINLDKFDELPWVP